MYGVAGERRLTEYELAWLPGYEGSAPVRIGNGAHDSCSSTCTARCSTCCTRPAEPGAAEDPNAWSVQRAMIETLEDGGGNRTKASGRAGPVSGFHPLQGHGVGRGRPRGQERSKVGLEGPVERCGELRDEIHKEVCEQGFDATATRSHSTTARSSWTPHCCDPPRRVPARRSDPRVVGHGRRNRAGAPADGFVCVTRGRRRRRAPARRRRVPRVQLLAGRLPAMLGAHRGGARAFDRLLGLRNDVGLFAEEYDPVAKRFLGNFPQAFTHLGAREHRVQPRPDREPGAPPLRRRARHRHGRAPEDAEAPGQGPQAHRADRGMLSRLRG